MRMPSSASPIHGHSFPQRIGRRRSPAPIWFEFLEKYDLLSASPFAPSDLAVAAASGTQINLTWTDNSSDETGFEIQRGDMWWGTYVTIATVGPGVTTFADTGLVTGNGYRYEIRALGAGGASDWCEGGHAVAATQFVHPMTQDVPAGKLQGQSNNGVWNFIAGVAMWDDGAWLQYSNFDFSSLPTTHLAIGAVTTNAGNIMEIHLDSPTGPLIGQSVINASNSWSVPTSTNVTITPTTGVHDVFMVFRPVTGSVNFRDFNFGPNYAPANTVPGGQLAGQDAPLVFSQANGNLLSVYDANTQDAPLQITLSVTHGSLTLAGNYGLTMLTGTGTNDTTVSFWAWPNDIYNALNGLQFRPDPGYAGVALLTFTSDDMGYIGSGGPMTDIDTVSINVLASATPPLVPTNLTAQAVSDSAIALTWGDGSNNETGFEIQRATTTGVYATIATVGANVTSYTDTGLASGAVYRYRVRAINLGGASNWLEGGNNFAATRVAHSVSVPFDAVAYQMQSSSWNFASGVAMSAEGSWLMFSDFDLTGVNAFTAAYTGPTPGNTLDIRLDSPTGPMIGQLALQGTGGYSNYESLSTALEATSGVHDVYLVYHDIAHWGYNFRAFSFGQNTAPVNTLPAPQILLQNTPLTLSVDNGNLINIADTDNDSLAQVTLSVDHGRLALAQVNGLIFSSGDGAADASMTFKGYLNDINAALNGMTYTPDTDFTGADTLTVSTDDQGFTGSGGPLTSTSGLSISVRNSLQLPAAPTSPMASGLLDTQIDLSWTVNSADDTGFEIQRAVLGQNTWTTIAVTAAHASTYQDIGLLPGSSYRYRVRALNDSGPSAWAAGGAFAATTAYRHNLALPFNSALYQAQSGGVWNANDSIRVVDGGWVCFRDFDFSSRAAPGFSTTASAVGGGGIIEVRLDSPDGTQIGQVTISGTGAADHFICVNAALDAVTGVHDVFLVFRSSASQLTVRGVSLGANLPPGIMAPGNQITPRATALILSASNGNLIRIADADNSGSAEQVTLTVSHGVLSLGQTTGLVFSEGSGVQDSTMTFQGTIADINAALAQLTFMPTGLFWGTATLTITADDLGAGGFGGPLTSSSSVSIIVSSVDTAPTVLSKSPDSTIIGTSVALSVTAQDDGGEENLTYTWDIARAPADATVAFSANGDNASKNTVATFDKPGAYTFTVTISDGTNVTTASVTMRVTLLFADQTNWTGVNDPEAKTPKKSDNTGKDAEKDAAASPTGANTPKGTIITVGGLFSAPGGPAPAGDQANGPQVQAVTPAPRPQAVTPIAPVAPAAPTGVMYTGGITAAATDDAAPVAEAPKAMAEVRKTIYELIKTPMTVQAAMADAAVQELVAAAQEIEKQVESHKAVRRVLGTIASVSATTSVGFMIWAARGGSLAMSMLTSVPMWRFLDPLPVLNSVQARRRRSWFRRNRRSKQIMAEGPDEETELFSDMK